MQRTAVITGGSRGIGLALCAKFLSEGFRVISISRSEGELGSLRKAWPGMLHAVFADLSEKEQVLAAASQVIGLSDGPDVLVNNAGVFLPGELHSEEDRVFELQMALNVHAAYYMCKALIPGMKKKPDAYIFNICSTASLMAYSSGGSYSVSKHALLGLSRVLRRELMPFRIGVSSVLPGATYTDSWKDSGLAEDRFMRPSVIADAVWFAWQSRHSAVMEDILLRPLQGDI